MRKALPLVFVLLYATFSHAQNVGIGTNAPQTKLDINGALSARITAVAANTNVTIPDNVTLFRLTNTNGGSTTALTLSNPKDGQFLTIINEDDNTATLNGYTIPSGTAASPSVSNFVNIGSIAAGWKTTGDNTIGGGGATGPTGATGTQGVTGDTGPQGNAGVTGPTGQQGIQGVAGPQGPAGNAGPTGATGQDGVAGSAGANGKDAYTTTTAGYTQPSLGNNVSVSVVNTSWMVVGQVVFVGGSGGYYVVNSITNSTTAVLTYFGGGGSGTVGATGSGVSPSGQTGANGAAGAQGPAGPTGTAGSAGAQGPAGPTGATGSTGSLSAGAAAGNTPYWNGTQWVLNSSNIYNNGGNVGMGTTNPETSLHVATQSTSTPRGIMVHQSNNGNNSGFLIMRKDRGIIGSPVAIQNGDPMGTIYSEGYDGTAFTRSGANIKFVSNGPITSGSIPSDITIATGSSGVGTERMRILSTGEIGIGTSAPVFKLDVQGATVNARIGNLQMGAWPANNVYAYIGHDALSQSATGNYALLQANDGTTYLNRSGGKTLYFREGNADQMVILNGGNVGIGTVSPGAKLEIAGQVKITGGSPGAGKVLTSDAGGLGTWTDVTTITGVVNGTGSNGHVSYWTGTATQAYDNTGNFYWDAANDMLGIGTTTPGRKLELYGTSPGIKINDPNATGNAFVELVTVDGGTSYFQNFVGRTRIHVGGAERMTFLNNGNIGVATSTPVTRFSLLSGEADFTTGMSFGRTNTSNGKYVLTNSDNNVFRIAFAGNIGSAHVDYTNRIVIDAAGNVGIGTAGPGAELDVFAPNTGLAQSNAGGMLFQTQDGLGRMAIATYGNIDGTGFPDAVASALKVRNVSGTGRSITASGNIAIGGGGYFMGSVGIGVVSPSRLLEVYGSTPGVKITDPGATGNAFVELSTVDGGLSYFQNTGARTRIVVGGAERMTFLTGGNIGVGTAAPLAALQINTAQPTGTVTATAVGARMMGQLDVQATDAYTTQKGGRITLSGVYNSGGALSTFAAIQGKKFNALDNNSGGNLEFITGNNATGAETVNMIIDNVGNVNIPALTASSAVYTDASKNLTTSIPTSGSIGYWTRTGTNLYNTTLTDNVGVGTSSPSAKLHVVNGSGTGINAQASMTDVSQGMTHIFAATHNLSTNIGVYGILNQVVGNVTGGTGAGLQGIFNQQYVNIQNNATLGASYTTFTRHATLGASPTGTITNMFDEYSDVLSTQHTGTANLTINNHYGSYIGNKGSGGTGITTQNAYGLYIADQTGATNTNYSLYSVGGTNYFGGRVGVGTATPSEGLTIAKDNGSLGLQVKTDANAFNEILFKNASGGNIADILSSVTPTAYGSENGGLSFFTGSSFAAPRMVIKSSGNVGIGTISPGRLLEVYGSTPGIKMNDPNASGNAFVELSTVDGGLSYFQNNGGRTRIYVGGERLTFLTNGNVGVNTPSPDATLDVTGTMKVFGSRTGLALNTIYQAPSDGFISAFGKPDGTAGNAVLQVFADFGSNPTTLQGFGYCSNSIVPLGGNTFYYPGSAQVTVPVRKGEYYKITFNCVGGPDGCNPGTLVLGSSLLYFTPLGH